MRFIMQNNDTKSYLVIDTTLCISQNSIETLDEAITAHLCNAMNNKLFMHVEDEDTLRRFMKQYIDWTFIQFVYDEPASYEYW